jgi:hypothetical protein
MRRRAGALVAALIMGTGLGTLAGAGPAAAGGWAVTVIDPLPGRIVAGQAYQVGFWVLQHGSHPYSWAEPASIGRVGLTLTDDRGAIVSFDGRALAEPAHYTTTVTVPHDGSWRVTGVQGVFMSFHVGTLTVPGSLAALGVPAAPSPEDMKKYWPGSVRPPVLPVDRNRDPFAAGPSDVAGATEPATAPAARPVAEAATEPAAQRGIPAPLLAAAIAGAALVLAFGIGRLSGWHPGRLRARSRGTGM